MCMLLSANALSQGGEWTPVTGAEALRTFMSGLKAERELPNGEMSRGEYNADGSATLYAWGAAIPRKWTIKGENQVCLIEKSRTECYTFEKNTSESNLYRVRDINTGVKTEFKAIRDHAIAKASPQDVGASGGAATPSAAEIAAELSNPNTSVATLTFKNQFRWFDGDLADLLLVGIDILVRV